MRTDQLHVQITSL